MRTLTELEQQKLDAIISDMKNALIDLILSSKPLTEKDYIITNLAACISNEIPEGYEKLILNDPTEILI